MMISRMRLLLCALVFVAGSAHSTTFTVTSSGFSFLPENITINVGDTVIFSIASTHTVVEVSQATWTANGDTPLPGGFSLPSGGGELVITAAGTHYYVCGIHYSMGMKGTITVVNTPLSVGSVLPSADALAIQSLYPNPLFAARTTTSIISFTSANGGSLRLSLFNALGKEVAVVYDGAVVPGQAHIESFDVSSLPAGVYFYLLRQKSLAVEKKLSIVK